MFLLMTPVMFWLLVTEGPMSGHYRLEVEDNNDAASIIYEARIYSEKLLICTLIGY